MKKIKKILSILIIFFMVLTGILTPVTISKSTSIKSNEQNKSIKDEIRKNAIADLKIREEEGNWYDHSIEIKVDTVLEFKIKISSIIQFDKLSVVFFSDKNSSNTLGIIESSISDQDNLVKNDDSIIYWNFSSVESEKTLTFKAKATEKGDFTPFVIVVPEKPSSLRDIDWDFDKLKVTSSGGKFFLNKMPSIYKLISFIKNITSLEVVKKIPFLKNLINHETELSKTKENQMKSKKNISSSNLPTTDPYKAEYLEFYESFQNARKETCQMTISLWEGSFSHGLGVHYYGMEWDSDFNKWRYKFRILPIVHCKFPENGKSQHFYPTLYKMQVELDYNGGITGHGHALMGGKNVKEADEEDDRNWDDLAQFVISKLIDVIPGGKYITGFLGLAGALQSIGYESDSTDVYEWEPINNNVKEAAGILEFELFAKPGRTWEVTFDLATWVYGANHNKKFNEFPYKLSDTSDDVTISKTAPEAPTTIMWSAGTKVFSNFLWVGSNIKASLRPKEPANCDVTFILRDTFRNENVDSEKNCQPNNPWDGCFESSLYPSRIFGRYKIEADIAEWAGTNDGPYYSHKSSSEFILINI